MRKSLKKLQVLQCLHSKGFLNKKLILKMNPDLHQRYGEELKFP